MTLADEDSLTPGFPKWLRTEHQRHQQGGALFCLGC